MTALNSRLKKLENTIINRPLSSLSDDELNARIVELFGYLPSEEEISKLLKELRQELNAGN